VRYCKRFHFLSADGPEFNNGPDGVVDFGGFEGCDDPVGRFAVGFVDNEVILLSP
jgi:hypothetical protein